MPDVISPVVSITPSTISPVESQSLLFAASGSDNASLKRISIYWDDGAVHSNSIVVSKNPAMIQASTGPLVAGQEITFWASAEDASANFGQTPRQTVIVLAESVTSPAPPRGSETATPRQQIGFVATGSSSSLGGSLEYQFDWGDGSLSAWGSTNQPHVWANGGDYLVRARARTRDQERVHHLWKAAYKGWFPQGPTDPAIALIQVPRPDNLTR